MTKERLENIIHELIGELSCGADEDYLDEIFDNIFSEEEKEYFGI